MSKSIKTPAVARDCDYVLKESDDFPFYTLHQAADVLEISAVRCSRYIRLLQIPVHRVGYLVLLDHNDLKQILGAIEDEIIRPGRPKRSETV